MSQETTTQPIMNDSNYANDSNPKPEPLMYDALARHSYLQKARTGVACPMNDRNAQCGVDVSKNHAKYTPPPYLDGTPCGNPSKTSKEVEKPGVA